MDVIDAVVKVMEDEGVEVAFGVPGATILPLYKAMSRSEQIRHYPVRHEEGGTPRGRRVHAGHGKVGINIGTSVVPAGTNMNLHGGLDTPDLYLCCGQAGPLGWEVPACIGVKPGRPGPARSDGCRCSPRSCASARLTPPWASP